jgi:hypothetical protein
LTRALLDPASTAQALHTFDLSTATLAKLTGLTFEDLQNRVNRGEVPDGFQGYIADELRNITFTGEQDAANEMLRRFASYMAVAERVRDADRTGKHLAALELGLGDSADHLRGAHRTFIDALNKVLDINQKEFDAAVDRGFADVDGLTIWIVVATFAAALLAQWGVSQRLKEYRI